MLYATASSPACQPSVLLCARDVAGGVRGRCFTNCAHCSGDGGSLAMSTLFASTPVLGCHALTATRRSGRFMREGQLPRAQRVLRTRKKQLPLLLSTDTVVTDGEDAAHALAMGASATNTSTSEPGSPYNHTATYLLGTPPDRDSSPMTRPRSGNLQIEPTVWKDPGNSSSEPWWPVGK